VFENRVLKRIFGSKRDQITRGWRKLHNKKLHNLYSSPSIFMNDEVKENVMGRACNTNGGKEESIYVISGKARGNKLLGRPRLTWVDNINMDLGEMRWGGMDWIGLTQDSDQWRVL
jgi:hypothetical protein